ncbi:serine hydrolase domain-containing protein, partial [Bacillus sp. D-CC]
MKKRNSMKLASLTVLLAGTTLFTPGFTVKAESTQSISNSSKVHDQKNRNGWKQVLQETIQIGAPGVVPANKTVKLANFIELRFF